MGYISLYRKYRSQTFNDVIGQDHVIRTIKNAIKSGKIGQGYLFCGSRGTGKTSVARLIAKALNCQSFDGPSPEPCNTCDACLSITNGSAVDVLEMDAASNRGVDDVGDLRDSVKYSPMILRYKVYIIDEAHQLTPQAKDAFLKTLEEPPPHAVFILATTEAHKIPVTIRSRCQQFDFRRGSNEEIESRLRYVVEQEEAAIDEDALDLLARSANGSYRDSLSLLEQVISYTEGKISAKEVTTVLGMVDEDVLFELGDMINSGDTSLAFEVADKILSEGRDVKEVLKSAAGFFRDVLAVKAGADKRRASDERWRDQAAKFSHSELIRLIGVFSSAEKELRWNDQHRIGLEMAFLHAIVKPAVVEAAPIVRTEPARQQTQDYQAAAQHIQTPKPENARPIEKPDDKSRESVEQQNKPVKTAHATTNTPDDKITVVEEIGQNSQVSDISIATIQREWRKIVNYMKGVMRKPQVAAISMEALPISLEGNSLTIGFTKKWIFHKGRFEAESEIVRQAIREVLKADLKIITINLEETEESQPQTREQERKVEKPPEPHPMLNDVLTTFSGEIVKNTEDYEKLFGED